MRYKAIFVLIFLLGSFVRLFLLGSLPQGLTWDEAAIGYNAHSIATVHRDEWLFRMPISFRSFGDYKSPLLIYIVSGQFYCSCCEEPIYRVIDDTTLVAHFFF